MNYIVVIETATDETGDAVSNIKYIGPYRSFKAADADARAWDGGLRNAYVEPLTPNKNFTPWQ